MERLDISSGQEFYLGFARGRVKALRAAGLKYASQKYDTGDASISVRIVDQNVYIKIDGSQRGYQFVTSTPVLVSQDISGASFKYILGDAVGANVAPSPEADPAWQATATGSSLEESSGAKRWPFVPASQLGKKFRKRDLWQVQGITEHAFFPSKDGKLQATPLVSVWSPSNPLHTLTVFGGAPEVSSHVDVTYDIPPILPGGKPQAPDADWYRRAAIRTVTSATFGSRRFIILTDTSNVFHVYPSGAADSEGSYPESTPYLIQGIKTNVAQKFVQSVACPFPAWVRAAEVASRDFWAENGSEFGENVWLYEKVPQYLWQFNSTATKACAVVFEDRHGIALNDPAETIPFYVRGDATYDIVESLPGMLELDITITITGPKPENFTATLTVARELRPTVSGQYVMAADYAWPVGSATELDDLVILEGEIYHTSDERTSMAKFMNIEANKRLAIVKNLTKATTLRTFLTHDTNQVYDPPFDPFDHHYPAFMLPEDENYKLATAMIIAMDLRILAFVIQQRYVEQDATWSEIGGIYQPTLGATSQVQRVKTYAYNEVVDDIAMDAESLLNVSLIAMHADTATDGLFKFPIAQIGLYPDETTQFATRSAYQATDIFTEGFASVSNYFYVFGPMNEYGGDYNVGPYFYARRMASALQLDSRSVFAVYPNGEYSIATNPVFYHAGPTPVDPTAADFDLTKMRQAIVDIVSFRRRPVKDEDGNVTAFGDEIKTTHLALFNSAFGKTLSMGDFFFVFSKTTDEAIIELGTVTTHRLKVESPNGKARYYILEQSLDTDPHAVWAIPNFAPKDIDYRYGPTYLLTFLTNEDVFDVYAVEAEIYDPFLNGSALFF